MDDWQRRSEQLLRTIASDFEGVPIYLIDASDSPIEVRDCRGWTGSNADLMLRDSIDDWQGRGFAAVVDVASITTWRELFGVVLHEAAHCLSQPIGITKPVMLGDKFRILLLALAKEAVVRDERATLPKWFGHELEFVRAAAHLAYRAGKMFESIHPQHVSFASPYYGPHCNENAILAALDDELESKQPIREIVATAMPTAFAKLMALAMGLGQCHAGRLQTNRRYYSRTSF